MDINRALNILLADEYKVLVKTRGFHWNVTGPFFGPLHELFGDQYNQLNSLTDTIAERIRQLKGQPFGSMQQFISTGTLYEDTTVPFNYTDMINHLVMDHEDLIKDIRRTSAAVNTQDSVTANILLEWAAKHEKMAWFLRAHLEADKK